MESATNRLRDDFQRHLLEELQAWMTMKTRQAHAVLPVPDLALMLIEVARAMQLGALEFAIQHADMSNRGNLYDMMAESNANMVLAAKDHVLAVAQKQDAARGR